MLLMGHTLHYSEETLGILRVSINSMTKCD